MSFKNKQLFLLLFFALLSVGVYQGFFRENTGIDYEPFTKGYALTNVEMQSTDDSGQIVTQIHAPNMTHYLDNEQTVIEQPTVHLFTVDNTWQLQSPTALYQRNTEYLYFPDRVTVVSQQAPLVTIESSQLSIDLSTKEGSTPAAISFNQPAGMMQGVGAHILFNSKQIEILNNVYAEFEPH
ncbi:MAG: LPS export ABC transporter periplasmic protein LptC [Proteobacteria bacterium]|nr:MAG: LPS export ABC transporter periplasmic protein LptC [Pseudomonadota bacterium]